MGNIISEQHLQSQNLVSSQILSWTYPRIDGWVHKRVLVRPWAGLLGVTGPQTADTIILQQGHRVRKLW